MENQSPLQAFRARYQPVIPSLLSDLSLTHLQEIEKRAAIEPLRSFLPHTFEGKVYAAVKKETQSSPALRIGVAFSGGPAAGGHNVIAGLFDAFSKSRLFGFLNGPSGIIASQWKEISKDELSLYRNQGGFDLIGSGRTKIETQEQMRASLETVQRLALDGLVIIGGDDSNTNAALLAEYFLEMGCATRVIGVPKTIDGDLRSEEIEISFGFDTACKTYSELIGNIGRDALSMRKYYHFIKLMGRSASHVALECALATRPNLTLIGEERRSLEEIIRELADLIEERFRAGKEYGVILIPEGLVEFVPDLLTELPSSFEKDPHGNIPLSQIDTASFLIERVQKELKKRSFSGNFSAQTHFFGYEGRCALPTNFDADYGYALGKLAALAIRDGVTGGIAAIQNLSCSPEEWKLKVIPIASLMHFEERLGKKKPVIRKALVDLRSSSYRSFAEQRVKWRLEDDYCAVGPIQFAGDFKLTNSVPLTLRQ